MNTPIEFITASAGSGKTHRLVEIVSEAIESGTARPQGIVATTFTVAAANELRERLASKFHDLDRHHDAVFLRFGMIGTVHGICLELLTRFALEAGLSPEVTILDDTQSQILVSRAFDAILTGSEEQELYRLSSRLSQVDWQTGTHHFRSLIPGIVANARSNDIAPSAIPAIGVASWEEMKANLPTVSRTDLDRALAEAIKGALREIDQGSSVKLTQRYLTLLRESARALGDTKLGWGRWNKLASAAPAKAESDAALPVQEIASRLGEHPGFHEDHEAYLRTVFQMAGRLAEQFGELKRESGTADFADLEKEALDLLTASDTVRSILKEEIDLLVVDEFQDTSPIQLALFSRLAECAKRVVWVGDVKQAIYGFRGADPELIISAVAGAEKSGTLSKSWRSTPDLVSFVNAAFAEAFDRHLDLPRDEVALTPHRETAPELPPALRIAQVTTGVTQLNGNPKRLNKSERHAATADVIQEFLHSGEQVVDQGSITPDDPVGRLRPVTPRDVAVLVRTRKNADAIAAELRARGIDVSLSAPGLLATPECQLALASLRVLVDPRDSLATAEIIALEAEHGPEAWLRDRLKHLKKLNELTEGQALPAWGTEGVLVSPGVRALVNLRKERDLTTLGPLTLYDLATATADVSDLVASWGPTQQRATQRLANLSRLREFIAEYQESAHTSGAPATLNGLFGWLADLADDYGASEAHDKSPVDPEIDAVHVGTYHGAKGLEWPVVVATDLDTAPRSRLFSLRPHNDADTLDLANPLDGRSLRLWVHPFGRSNSPLLDKLHASEAGQDSERSALSEELRLLYVGLTRARDTLVLVHDPATSADWLDLTGMEDLIHSETGDLTLGSETIPLTTTTQTDEILDTVPQPETTIEIPIQAKGHTERLPLLITPSSEAPTPDASVAEIIEFGRPLTIPGSINARDYGDAMHRIIAAEIQNPDHPDRASRTARLLAHWGLNRFLSPDQVLSTVDTYRQWVAANFAPTTEMVEVPFACTTAEGQQSTGFIDQLLHTDQGPVILDHKIFPGTKDAWEAKALSYSGQLALYRMVVHANIPDSAPPATWIHLATAGAAIRIETPTSLS